ncbi:MAG: hypothetical protein HN576_08935 [Bacteriovoracaceae bacterium]|jgi:hypothetical protein|nr:hypothetical protein [Bacteriovoracaceae bacterium]
MNTKEITQNILLLLKLDSKRLYDRIKYRSPEYLSIFSNKRTREHFREIFKNRYDSIEIEDLKLCSESVIRNVDEFYHFVDEMKWYLNTTEDMPNTVDDKIHKLIAKMNPILIELHTAIDMNFREIAPKYSAPVDRDSNDMGDLPETPDFPPFKEEINSDEEN